MYHASYDAAFCQNTLTTCYYLSSRSDDLVDVDGFGEDGSQSLPPSHRLILVFVDSSRLGHVDVVVAAASSPQEQHGSPSRGARLPRAVRRRHVRQADRRLLLRTLRTRQTTEAAEDVLVQEAESGGHDEAEVRQRVQRQRNSDNGVEHRRQASTGRAWRYVTVTCNADPPVR